MNAVPDSHLVSDGTQGSLLNSRFLWGTIYAVLACGSIGGIWFYSQPPQIDEKPIRMRMEELGGLIIMDANRHHAATLNLSIIQSPEKFDEAMSLVPQLRQLEVIDATGTTLKNEHLAQLPRMRQLKSFHANQTAIGDEALETIRRFKRLQSLHLGHTQITDKGLARLGTLSQLIILDLSGTKIAPNLRNLTRWKMLQWLVMREVPLNTQAADVLKQMPVLGRLTVSPEQVDKEVVAKIQELCPKVRIE